MGDGDDDGELNPQLLPQARFVAPHGAYESRVNFARVGHIDHGVSDRSAQRIGV